MTSSLLQQGDEMNNLREMESSHRIESRVLQIEKFELQSRLTSLRAEYEAKIVDLKSNLDENVRSEIALESYIDSMIRENAKKCKH